MNKIQLGRADFPHIGSVSTRWTDNDIYGHVNNAVYYHYFDSVINAYLIDAGGLDIHRGEVVGFVVHSECDYFAPVRFPGTLEVGLATRKVGNTSVTYQVGLFQPGAQSPSALGVMVHVFVDQATGKPVALPAQLRQAMERIAMNTGNV
ncbi:MAG: acyl-CoA thioester hydrolase [Rhodoferax sp.]|jgi:acyl-CoA thioester hydrolase